MMRRLGVLCVCLLLAACTGSGVEGSEVGATSLPPATSSADTVTTSSAGAIPTTGTPVAVPLTTVVVNTTMGTTEFMPEQPVLIVNGDGVFEINTDGAISHLVDGPVAYAVDDTRGGLLFQVERGRQVFTGFEGEPPSGRPTIIWWIPAGAAAPQGLLVPTPGEGQYLSLHDAFAVGDSFAVVYERHEGTVPFDSHDGRAADMADRLRVFDVASGSVTELYRVRGYEWNLADITAGAGLVSATEVQLYGGGCRLFDAGTGELATSSGYPSATPACFNEFTPCATSCALSPDAAQVAYNWVWDKNGIWEWEIGVVDLARGNELARFRGPGHASTRAELDIDGDLVLLNRTREGLYEEQALLADLGNPDSAPIALPLPGRARFTTAPVDIAATTPIESPLPGVLDQSQDGTTLEWQQDDYFIEKILPPAGSGSFFGDRVATDGVSIVVGVPGTRVSGARSGAVYVMTPTDTGWESQRILASDGEAFDAFGRSVDIENGVVVVGAPGTGTEEVERPDTPGAVYVYRKDGDDWLEEKLIPPEAAPGDGVGISVAVSGNRVYTGALRDTHAGERSGALYIYEQTDNGWVHQKVVASDAHAYQWFGWTLAADGDRVVVGTAEGDGCCRPGTAYVYEYVEGRWVETALTAQADHFGSPVSISGALVLVGANRHGNLDHGAAFLFDLEAGTVQELRPEGNPPDAFFGRSVAVTQEWIAVGAANDAEAAGLAGAAYVYPPIDGTLRTMRVVPPDAAAEQYFSRGLAAGRDMLVIGAPGDAGYTGAIYVVRPYL